jgi:hypothetical protein
MLKSQARQEVYGAYIILKSALTPTSLVTTSLTIFRGLNPHRINIHYFIVSLTRLLYQMFCNLYPAAENYDKTQKGIGTIRPEFLVGANANTARVHDQLIVTWLDQYPKTQHEHISSLFNALNEIASEPLSFLDDLKLKFELVPPRDKNLQNQQRRIKLDLG